MYEIFSNDFASLKLMTPYILLGVVLTIVFVVTQIIINRKGGKREKTK